MFFFSNVHFLNELLFVVKSIENKVFVCNDVTVVTAMFVLRRTSFYAINVSRWDVFYCTIVDKTTLENNVILSCSL